MILRAFHHDIYHYQLEQVCCGKPTCRRCPHGPYWYRYAPAGTRPRKKYLGKRLPPGVGPEAAAPKVLPAVVAMSARRARIILGIKGEYPRLQAWRAWMGCRREWHALALDRQYLVQIDLAWQTLCEANGW